MNLMELRPNYLRHLQIALVLLSKLTLAIDSSNRKMFTKLSTTLVIRPSVNNDHSGADSPSCAGVTDHL